MGILNNLVSHYKCFPEKTAVVCDDIKLTYRQLIQYSDELAKHLERNFGDNKTPIIVYGHKSPYMIVCFLACVKSGRAYCPVDFSIPIERVEDIIGEVNPPVVFDTMGTLKNHVEFHNICSLDKILEISMNNTPDDIKLTPVKDDELYYIIFTSGSTGKPKGVQITYNCLNNYLDWAVDLGSKNLMGNPRTYLNQAPLSFDLSVMDLYLSLATGGTLYLLDKSTQNDYKKLYAYLQESKGNVWVSTPSFMDMCLLDRGFNEENYGSFELFLFCGEVLTNSTARKLKERFPHAVVINTYGPAESTVCVTEVEITDQVIKECNPLPVGRVKPGTRIRIVKDGADQPEGERGEIVIEGNTVGTGYYKRPDITEKAFSTLENRERSYRTGDEGYFIGDMLYFTGRIDLQVKLNGYRIELEDIEKNLLLVDGIEKAVVLPVYKEFKVRSLSAFIVSSRKREDQFAYAQEIRHKLQKLIPDYMVPKKITVMESLPMTNNGKVDRRALGGK